MKLDFPKTYPFPHQQKLNSTFNEDGGGGDAALIQLFTPTNESEKLADPGTLH
jgi:hypothetical protein